MGLERLALGHLHILRWYEADQVRGVSAGQRNLSPYRSCPGYRFALATELLPSQSSGIGLAGQQANLAQLVLTSTDPLAAAPRPCNGCTLCPILVIWT